MKNIVHKFIIIIISLNSLSIKSEKNTTSISELNYFTYPEFCNIAAHNNTIFKNFRRNKAYIDIVEIVYYGLGRLFEEKIKKEYPIFLVYLKKLSKDDSIGDPIRYNYSVGLFSTTTLRYIKIAGDLKKEFGDLKNFNIVEIGGGYGGQCNVLHTVTGFKSYTIIDLPQCKELINKCLNIFQVKNFNILENTKINTPLKFDLFISNYAIAEIKREHQLNYIRNIINFCPYGYITYNIIKKFKSQINYLELNEFISQISIEDREIKIKKEVPSTSTDNWIITWRPKNKN